MTDDPAYRDLFQRNPLPAWVVDDTASANVVAVNDAAVAHYGSSAEEWIGRPIGDTGLVESGRCRYRTDDGEVIDVEVHVGEVEFDGKPARIVMAVDVGARNDDEARFRSLVHHDPLTGLPNRELFHDRLTVALARAARHSSLVAVLFLDLDRFKVVNDSLGHDAGDRLLVAVGHRLRSILRASDTVARFGGDEFAVLCEDVPDERETIALAERVVSALSQPFPLDRHEVVTTASVGIAISGRATSDRPDMLIRDADAAMYRAKERGRSRYEVFDDDMRARSMRFLQTETALRHALEQGELDVAFQPCVSLVDGSIRSFEALLRWTSPEITGITTSELISLAEETGLIVAVGSYVLEAASRQLAQWRASGFNPLLAVNVSARQLGRAELFDDITRILQETGLDPATICLEITESVLMDDAEASLEALYVLRSLGVLLAIDDFGTGYSSLTYLKRFPIDVLKLDREFVRGLGQNAADEAIIHAVVTLARAMDVVVIAEGVETVEQMKALQSLGCDAAQGYLFAKPLSATDATKLLVTQESLLPKS